MTPSAKLLKGAIEKNFKGSNKLWPQGASALGFSKCLVLPDFTPWTKN